MMSAGIDVKPVPTARHASPFGTRLILTGFAIVLGFTGVFAAWSMAVPIESGIVAPGVFSVDSNVRTVQHLEGGIVQEILVREGDVVEMGQVVIRLQDTAPISILNELRAQYYDARATEARLAAERDGSETIAFSDELKNSVSDQSARDAMASQETIFASRRALLADQLTILERTKSGLGSEVAGLEGLVAATARQIAFVEEERELVIKLAERGLVDKPRLLSLEREKAEFEGKISQSQAAIGTAQQRIEEAQFRMAELLATRKNEVVDQLRQSRARAYELAQRLATANDVMGRTEIRSPIAGAVVGLTVHTVGGVIAAGQPLLDVVPINDRLVIQATIDPLDIDQLTPGQPATVWLSAINHRSHFALEGRVQTISANSLTDPRTGASYYLARVELDSQAVERSTVPLQSGMGAEVMIRTGARTIWDYITAPMVRALSHAMREA